MKISKPPHPDIALFENQSAPPTLPVCEHIAGTPRFIEKAFQLQSTIDHPFDVTIDLEDGSPVGDLMTHAENLLNAVTGSVCEHSAFGLRLPHHSISEWQSLLRFFLKNLGERLRYITLPKIQNAGELQSIEAIISTTENSLGINSPIPFHVLIETYAALTDIDAIAANERVEVLDFGIMDFISEHLGGIPEECMRSPGQFEHVLIRKAKTTITEAAYRHGVVASHNVTTAYNDRAQTFEDALTARRTFGFSRMWSIHPTQIEAIIEAMTPTLDGLSRSQLITQKGHEANWSPIAVDGILHDRASFRYHWQVCKRAHRLGVALEPDFLDTFF